LILHVSIGLTTIKLGSVSSIVCHNPCLRARYALGVTIGSKNPAEGYYALYYNIIPSSSNTAERLGALKQNTTGSNNIDNGAPEQTASPTPCV
jgi:hypothetical protein